MKSLVEFIQESRSTKKQIKDCTTWKKFFDLGAEANKEEFNLDYAQEYIEEWIFPIKGRKALTSEEIMDLYQSDDNIEVEMTIGIGGGGSDEVVIKTSDGKEYVCDMIDGENYFKGEPSRC